MQPLPRASATQLTESKMTKDCFTKISIVASNRGDHDGGRDCRSWVSASGRCGATERAPANLGQRQPTQPLLSQMHPGHRSSVVTDTKSQVAVFLWKDSDNEDNNNNINENSDNNNRDNNNDNEDKVKDNTNNKDNKCPKDFLGVRLLGPTCQVHMV